MSDNKVVLRVSKVSKSFKLPTEHSNEIKQVFVNWTKGIKGYRRQEVLKDISFEVKRGDFFGIVGRNGSGKSTLLKLISGIYPPDHGQIEVDGSLVSFIELGVGFNPELTGRENIYLNGAMLGFSKKQIDVMYDDIVDFAELHDFMDQKLKNYSSGMQVRLAFSVAIKARGDILVLDEVLAVGDEAFQKKCNDYFFEAKRSGKTIILVTHDMGAVRQFCNKAIFINNGVIEAEGNPNTVANKYSGLFQKEYIERLKKSEVKEQRQTDDDVRLTTIELQQREGDKWKKVKLVDFRKEYRILFGLTSKISRQDVTVSIKIIDQANRPIHIFSTKGEKNVKLGNKDTILRFDVENILGDGDYVVAITVNDNASNKEILRIDEATKFTVLGQDMMKYSAGSLAHPEFKVAVE